MTRDYLTAITSISLKFLWRTDDALSMEHKTASEDHKIYFASDFHLGVPDYASSLEREKTIVRWLDTIREDVGELFLMGDLFDFWFEYQRVVPKGFTRLLGKLAFLADQGVPIHIIKGNHDLWMKDYLPSEFTVKLYDDPIWVRINDKVFYLAHGDGLGPGDKGYKFLKKVFTNKFCQWLFGCLHPNWGISLANYFSSMSRNSQDEEAKEEFLGEDREYLVQHAKTLIKENQVDFCIYGHRHYPIQLDLGGGSQYINLGDWISHYTYGVFDGDQLRLETFKE